MLRKIATQQPCDKSHSFEAGNARPLIKPVPPREEIQHLESNRMFISPSTGQFAIQFHSSLAENARLVKPVPLCR
jgi:hypothetical protein